MSIATVVTMGFGPGASGTGFIPTLGFTVSTDGLVLGPLTFKARVFHGGFQAGQTHQGGFQRSETYIGGFQASQAAGN